MQPSNSIPHIARLGVAESAACAAASLLAGAVALFLAASHPLWPTAVAALTAAWMVVASRLPKLWLFALPACLPASNFSPWSGWIGVDEFDLLVLATVCAAYARLACGDMRRPPPLSHWGRAVMLAVAVPSLFSLWRGVSDAGGWHFDWFQGYTEPLNSLRVGKSAIHALLLFPLLRGDWLADRASTFRRFALGMLVGAAVVTLAVLWERAAFPGLLNVQSPYRTVGLFWEMHVGGAALDAYVVVCTPFVAWALWDARAKAQWGAAALFALVWAYACLTTYSRGAYLGIAVSLLVLGLQLPVTHGRRWWPAARVAAFVLGAALLMGLVLDSWGHGATALALVGLGAAFWLGWRTFAVRFRRSLATGLMILALVFEVVVALGPDSYMTSRLTKSALDYESRTTHWRRGLDLLQGPDWLFGIGLGRLPAHYDRSAPRGEFSGGVQWQAAADGSAHVRIAGPRSRQGLGGRYGLTQRVPLHPAYRMRLDMRVAQPTMVFVRVCESHLLYDRACHAALIRVEPATDAREWQQRQFQLSGPALSAGRWLAPRQGVLTISVLDVGGRVDIDNVALEAADGQALLDNGAFSAGLAHWFPAAQSYFVPWHIDNLFLELVIERGLVGALPLMGLAGAVLWRLLRRPDPGDPCAPFIAAALCGVLCVGLMSSVLDVPRVALLLALLFVMGSNARLRQV